MTVVEGKALLEECMKVLYYRDGRTINRVSQTGVQFYPKTLCYPPISPRSLNPMFCFPLPVLLLAIRFKSARLLLPVVRSLSRMSWRRSGTTLALSTRVLLAPARGNGTCTYRVLFLSTALNVLHYGWRRVFISDSLHYILH